MKLEVLQEDLNQSLSVVSRFIASRPQLPVLANILFSAEKNNRLKLSATNLDIGIQYWIDAKVSQPGELTIPAKEISEFVSYLSPGNLVLETIKQGQIKINSKQGETKFAGMDAEEFPEMPKIKKEKSTTLPLGNLEKAVNLVGFAAADDDTRPVLAAVNWEFLKDGYQMVATDGYRLSIKKVEGVKINMEKSQNSGTFLIPARSLTEIVRLAAGEEELKVGLTEDENQVVFLLPGLQLTSRLIEGEFPEYEKIIPQGSKTKILVDKEEFHQNIRMASVFARESANVVKFKISDGKIQISSNAPSVGENETTVDAKVEGDDLEIAFNYRFLLDFLKSISLDEQQVEMHFKEPLTPGLFKAPTDEDWLHIIMPVKVDL